MAETYGWNPKTNSVTENVPLDKQLLDYIAINYPGDVRLKELVDELIIFINEIGEDRNKYNKIVVDIQRVLRS